MRPLRDLRETLAKEARERHTSYRGFLLGLVREAIRVRYVPTPTESMEDRMESRLVLNRAEKEIIQELANKAGVRPEEWVLEVLEKREHFLRTLEEHQEHAVL